MIIRILGERQFRQVAPVTVELEARTQSVTDRVHVDVHIAGLSTDIGRGTRLFHILIAHCSSPCFAWTFVLALARTAAAHHATWKGDVKPNACRRGSAVKVP